MKKCALIGLSRVKLFPLVSNSTSNYEVEEGFDVPWVQEMTMDPDTSETKIYGDDQLYQNFKSWNGLKSTMKFVEMPLEMIAKLGFGDYDAATKTVKWNPQGINREFAVSYRQLCVDGSYRLRKLFVFSANELKESSIKSKGAGNEVNTFELGGVFTRRLIDDLPGEIRAGDTPADIAWLDEIETVTV